MVRIRTPVKGQLCKHLQCFDYDSFMNLNSKNPCWCCPICKQSVSFVDIRIDQYMAKILKDAEFYVSNVIIFADKSWKTEQLQGSTSLSWSNTHKAPNEDSLTCVPYSRSFITFSADVMHASSQHMHKTTEVSLSFSAPANSLGHLAHGDRRTATNSNPDKHHQLGTCTMISHSTHLQQRTQVSQVQTFEELVGCSPENHASTRIQSAQEMALAGRQQVVGTQVREADKAMPSSLRPDTLRNWHTYQNTHIMDADRSSRLSSAELRHMQNSTVIRSVNPACSSCNVPLARFPARYGGFPHPQHQLSSSQYDKARLQTVRNQANFRGVEMSTTEHDPGGHRNEHA